MRFEVFLTQLPKASAARIKAEFSELREGVSNGVVLKTLETRQVPTVPVAWSDDKRDVNEVVDTLEMLGAECRLVDHGHFFQRIGTVLAERFGAPRYHEDEEDAPRLYRLGGHDREGAPAKLARHALTYLIEALVACALLAWTLWLELGLAAFSAERLSLFAACALGALAAYGVIHCTAAQRSGHLGWKQTLPVFAVAGALTMVAPFLLGRAPGTTAHAARIGRPPSLPFSGMLVELQRRKLAGEAAGNLTVAGDELAALIEAGKREAALSCMPQLQPVQEAACVLSRRWEDALACLPAPVVRAVEPIAPAVGTGAISDSAAKPARQTSAPSSLRARKGRLTVTFALVDVLWLLSLSVAIWLGVFWYERKAVTRAAAPTPAVGAAPDPAPTVEAAPPSADTGALAALEQSHAEALRALNGSHQSALAQLGTKLEQVESERGKLAAALAQASEDQQRFVQEAARGASAVARAEARAAKAEAEAKELRALTARAAPANDASAQGPSTGVGPAPARPLSDDSSSYSVSGGQEERVVLSKKRR